MTIRRISKDDFFTIEYRSTFNAEDGYMPISIVAKQDSLTDGNKPSLAGVVFIFLIEIGKMI